jgi:hypothetical protein
MRARVALSAHLSRVVLIILLCLIGGIAVVELRSLDNHFVGDDWEHLYVASTVHSVEDVLKLFDPATPRFIRPVHWLSTLSLYHLFGLAPAPYHGLGIILDFANAALLGLLVWRLQRLLGPGRAAPAWGVALAVAILFLANPRHHEAVFWHAALNEVLAAFFRLLTLNLMLSWLQAEKKRRLLYGLGMLTALLAFGSKESAVVIVLDLALLFTFFEYCSRRVDRRQIARTLSSLAPFVVMAVLFGAAYVLTIPGAAASGVQRSNVALVQADLSTLLLRLMQYLNANWIPVGWLSRHAGLLVLEGFVWIAVTLAAVRSKRWLWLFALGWTLLGVLPYVVIQYGTDVSPQQSLLVLSGDRYLYYSSAGAALLLVQSAVWLLETIRSRFPRTAFMAVAGAVCVAMLLLTVADMAMLAQRESEWNAAGQIADRILTETQASAPSVDKSTLLCLGGVPRTYGNRWVMGSTATYALYMRYGRSDFSVRIGYLPAPWEGPLPPLNTRGCTHVLTYDARTGVMQAP